MPSPGLIIFLSIVIAAVFSLAIAWSTSRKSHAKEQHETDAQSKSSGYARLVSWIKSNFGLGTHRSPTGFNRTNDHRSSNNNPQASSAVHFHFELEEGESVRVIAEGLPAQAASEASPIGVLPVEAPQVGNILPTPERVSDQPVEQVVLSITPAVSEISVAAAGQVQPVAEAKPSPITRAALMVGAVGLAIIPSLLVFLDRWRGVNLSSESLGKLWSSTGSLSQLVYPPYFIIVFAALIGIVILFWRVKGAGLDFIAPDPASDPPGMQAANSVRQLAASRVLGWVGGITIAAAFLLQIMLQQANGLIYLVGMLLFFLGWALRQVSWLPIQQRIQRIWKPVLAFSAFHIFLLASLSSFYSNRYGLWVWIIFTGVTLAVTLYFYRHRIPVVLWVMSVALVLYTIRINGWEFSVVGDEYSFFMYARELAWQHDLLFSINKLFNGVAVFGSHPFFSSFIQMVSTRLFSGSDFSWRFSNLYLCAAALVFFYLFFRTFLKSSTALLAITFLASSHYLMTFGKIGYNNPQAYFILSLVLAAGAWAVRARITLAYMALGLTLGTCFYVYPAALYALPIAFLLILMYDPPFSRPALLRWSAALLAFGILILPLILQKDYWSAKIPGTIFYTPTILESTTSLWTHIANNLLYAFLSFLYIPQEGHFVVSSYVDPVSGILVLLGLAYILTRGLKDRFVRFFLLGYACMLFLVGASHGGAYPPNTRMFMLLPWLALLAAAGVEWIWKQVKARPHSRVWVGGSLALILTGVVAFNLVQAYSLSRQRSTGLQSAAMLFVRVLERIQNQDPAPQGPLTIWFLTQPPWGIDGYRLFLTTYDIPDSLVQLQKVDVEGAQLPAEVVEAVRDQDALVIIYPDIEASQQEALGTSLANLGKQSCPVKTMNSFTRFLLWHSPAVDWVCELGE